MSSLPENHNTQSYSVATKSTVPGKSRHPYDTGVDKPTETIPESQEEQVIPPTQAQRRELPPRERIKQQILMRLSPRPKSTTESRPDNAGTTANKGIETQGISEIEGRGDPREPNEKSDSRKRWWRPFPKTQARVEGHQSQGSSGLEESDTTDDESDVAALIKPRSAWKSVKDRHRSTFPATGAPMSKPGRELSGRTRKQAQKNAALEQPDNQASALEPKNKADVHLQPEAWETVDGYLSTKPARESPEVPQSSPKQTRKRSQCSTPDRLSTTGSQAGRGSTSIPSDVATDPPKTPTQLMRLLLGSRRTPPSPAVSPLDINSSTVAKSRPTPPSRRPSTESRMSGIQSAEVKNKGWFPFWAFPKIQAESSPRETPNQGLGGTASNEGGRHKVGEVDGEERVTKGRGDRKTRRRV
ncbi:hypothetical protein F4775DRAFT_538133 [Biscogniauxia sp. FL1348]|nr:hypothetical protein F4775DRAFT_538133 [Biscogniauxia sp. FL1348]